jgi:hypothetical protein
MINMFSFCEKDSSVKVGRLNRASSSRSLGTASLGQLKYNLEAIPTSGRGTMDEWMVFKMVGAIGFMCLL